MVNVHRAMDYFCLRRVPRKMSKKKSRVDVTHTTLSRTLWRHVLSWLSVYHHALAARSCRQLYEVAQDAASWAPALRWSSCDTLDCVHDQSPKDSVREWPTLQKLWPLPVHDFSIDRLLLMKLQTLQLHFDNDHSTKENGYRLGAMESLSISWFRTVRHLCVKFSPTGIPARFLKPLAELPLETLVVDNVLTYDNTPFPAWPHLRHLSLDINDDLDERGNVVWPTTWPLETISLEGHSDDLLHFMQQEWPLLRSADFLMFDRERGKATPSAREMARSFPQLERLCLRYWEQPDLKDLPDMKHLRSLALVEGDGIQPSDLQRLPLLSELRQLELNIKNGGGTKNTPLSHLPPNLVELVWHHSLKKEHAATLPPGLKKLRCDAIDLDALCLLRNTHPKLAVDVVHLIRPFFPNDD
jgi:hypothetical protein